MLERSNYELYFECAFCLLRISLDKGFLQNLCKYSKICNWPLWFIVAKLNIKKNNFNMKEIASFIVQKILDQKMTKQRWDII